MAAELEKLSSEASQLAKQFKRAGQPGLANILDADAHGFRAKANIAKSLGIPSFASNDTGSKPTVPEKPIEIQRFNDEEKQALIGDGAIVYELVGETINSQKISQKAKEKPSFWFVTSGSERLVGRPSRLSEVAIYPDPERFFIENSGSKNLTDQEELAEKDGESLRNRLGLQGITVVVPDEASTLTEVTFKHLDETGDWLFGQKYAQAHDLDWIYGRTKNPTNANGSGVAYVGYVVVGDGLDVSSWYADLGTRYVWAVRLVVPKEIR